MRTAPPANATFARAAAVAGIACLLGIAGPALAQRRNPPVGVPAPRGSGRFIPVLGDGTVREPSIDRAEAVDSPDTLAPHRLQWEVTLAGASTDRIGTLDKQGLEAGAVSLTFALRGGADVSVRSAAWERTRID